MRIIICGSRDWDDAYPITHFLDFYRQHGWPHTIVHGGARGADQLAGTLARGMGFEVEEHKADWTGRGRTAGHERNRLMLDLGADLVVAFKNNFDGSMTRGGTENMVRIAMEAGVRTLVLPFDTRGHVAR